MLPNDMQIAILAGGLAIRLGALTRNEPKSLLKFEGKPFIQYQIEQIGRRGIKDIVICTGHLGEQIERCLGDGARYGLSIRYRREDKPLGTAGALKNAENLLKDSFITIYGDSYLSLDFGRMFNYFVTHQRLGMMTVYRNFDHHDRSNASISGGFVTGYSKSGRTTDMVYIDYGAQLFRKQVLNLIPAGTFYPLENLFPQLILRQQLLSYEVGERFYEIGSRQGIREFSEYLRGKA
jgi:MurNAc alpha-1-phosphate uridylyltransferase